MKKILFLIIVVSILVAVSTIFIIKGNNSNNNEYDPTNNINNGELVEPDGNIEERPVNKMDSNKDLVYFEKYNENINVPVINLDYEYIKQQNELAKTVLKMVDPQKFECKYYLNNGILSVVGLMESKFGVTENNYYIHNIDIYTGNELSNRDILAYIGKSEEEQAIMTSFKSTYAKEFASQNQLVEKLKNNFGINISLDELASNLNNNNVICTKEYYDSNNTSSYSYENTIAKMNDIFTNSLSSRVDGIKDIEEISMYLGTNGEIQIVSRVEEI